MWSYRFSLFLLVVVLGLSGCNAGYDAPPKVQLQTREAENPNSFSAGPSQSYMRCDAEKRMILLGDMPIRAWNLRGQNVKFLVTRILVFQEGKMEVHSEMGAVRIDNQTPLNGQLLCQLQFGDPFGVTDQVVPAVQLTIQSDADFLPAGRQLKGKPIPGRFAKIIPGAIPPSTNIPMTVENMIVSAQILVPVGKDPNRINIVNGDLEIETLKKFAQDGHVVVAVSLEWKGV